MAVIKSAFDSSAACLTRAAGADSAADQLGKRRDASGFFGVAAELGLKDHAGELGGMRLQGNLAVLFPKERRVAEARPHDAFVALANLGRIAALDIADRDEPA